MKITILTPILAAMAIGIDSVSATNCFSSGADFANRDTAKYHAKRACEGYDGKAGAFQGYFNPSATKSACVNVAGGHIYMEVTNQNTGAGFNLGDSDCTKQLWERIDACAKGGISDVAGWHFL
jgi:hypothetical protein